MRLQSSKIQEISAKRQDPIRGLTIRITAASAHLTHRQIGVPGMAGLRLDMREAGAGRWAGNVDNVLAAWALNLPTGVARVALQGLVAVGTVELELRFIHSLHPSHA